MEIFGDSNLVIRHIQGDWKTRDVKLSPISCLFRVASREI